MTRIAFVGGGPKALFALWELHRCHVSRAAGDLHIDVYDPWPPGAGRVWQAGQPVELRLNVAVGILEAGAPAGQESFASWVGRVAPRYAAERYPPRVVVGAYLHEQFQSLAGTAGFRLTHVPARVTAVVRAGQQWLVHTDAGSEVYNEVVLATGHGLGEEATDTQPAASCNTEPLIGRYQALDEERIPPGSQVLIRGAALTAYDAVLLLTEGRGGRWVQLQDTAGRSLRYVPSGREPAQITLGSRSALPMDAKAEAVPESIRSCLEGYRPRVLEWGKSIAGLPEESGAAYTGLFRILLACAIECAEISGAPTTPLALWRTALRGSDQEGRGNVGPAEAIRHGIAVNRGLLAPGTHWIWARVWSGLYPDVVRAVSRVRWEPTQGRRFGRLASTLERMAFGPPEDTALKMLALFDAGLLEQDVFPASLPKDAILLDALTPPAGVLNSPAPTGRAASALYAGLLDAGEIVVRDGERGLLTDTDGTCIDAAGQRNESLAALGRPTDGPTLGHDTLNRTLHPEHLRWAQRIVHQPIPQHLGERS